MIWLLGFPETSNQVIRIFAIRLAVGRTDGNIIIMNSCCAWWVTTKLG